MNFTAALITIRPVTGAVITVAVRDLVLREKIPDPATVERYVPMLNLGMVPPPILIMRRDDDASWLVHDGTHRTTAARRVGVRYLDAIIVMEVP
jgi:hypothetical protein